MPDQFRCQHGHAYYDGDQALGNPYDDGHHDAWAGHGHADVADWEPWERDAYEEGYRNGGYRTATVQALKSVIHP